MTEIAFKPLAQDDLPLLFTWFNQPYIAELWKEPTAWIQFQEKFMQKLRSKDTFPFIAYRENKPFGYIQYHHVNDEDRKLFPDVLLPQGTVGLDLFIGDPAYLDKGYGTRLLATFIKHLKTIEPSCKLIIIDPAPDNHRAIGCYQKVGFKAKGIYETPYGPIGSGPGNILLMTYES